MDVLILIADWIVQWIMFPISLVILAYTLFLHLFRIYR